MSKVASALRTSALLALLAGVALAAPATANVRFGSTGWTWGDPQPQGAALNAVAFAAGTNVGYAAGAGGTLLKSIDNGDTWAGVRTGTFASMDAVQVLDPKTVIVSGACAARRSLDAGRTFTRVAFTDDDTDCSLAGLSFVSPTAGFALLNDGTVLTTGDGGASFDQLAAVPDTQAGGGGASATAIAFASPTTGLVASDDGSGTGAKVYRTTDGGLTWQLVISGAPTVNAIAFADAAHGYVVGRSGLVLRSDDGGANWAQKDLGAGPVSYTGIACAGAQLCVLSAADAATDSGAELVRTINGGDTPGAAVVPSASDTTNAAAFASPDRVVAVGDAGSTDTSDDGGQTFSQVDSSSGNYTAVRAGARRGIAYALGREGSFATSSDGGANWDAGGVPTGATVIDASFAGSSTGYALDSVGRLFRTTNGGGSWRRRSSGRGGRARGLAAPSSRVVVLVGPRGMRRSTNGGGSYKAVGAPVGGARLSGVARARGATIVAWGPSALVRSTNGGASWTALGRPKGVRLGAASFASATSGLVKDTRGRVWWTRNGGRGWSLLSALGTEAISELAAGSARDLYATVARFDGGGATVLHSRDGGLSWQPEYVDDGALGAFSIAATGGIDYATVGGGAGLLATGSGGTAGARPRIALTTPHRRLPHAATITVSGRLRTPRQRFELVVSMLAPGATRWSHQDVTADSDGTFSSSWRVRRGTTRFVAQWIGDVHSGGAGSRALTVTVRR
jgi:photosystem II stability/assembly factor-like uncharacterized protein